MYVRIFANINDAGENSRGLGVSLERYDPSL
jgi:hypothetical protein